MKTLFLGLSATLGALIFPSAILIFFMILMVGVDFATGYASAVRLGENRTSSGLRKTITKIIQYGSVIVIALIVVNSANYTEETWLKTWAPKLNNALLIYIIYIEIYSVLENLIKLSPESAFTKFLINPAYNLLSINLKNLFKKSD
jgi:Bacteriophage holin family